MSPVTNPGGQPVAVSQRLGSGSVWNVSGGGQRRGSRFRYENFVLDADTGTVTLTYSLDGRFFNERVNLSPGPHLTRPDVRAAVRLIFLLSGISYYKTAAPPLIDFGEIALTDRERDFMRTYYVDGLAEFAYKNELDLSTLVLEASTRSAAPVTAVGAGSGRPLVPFGGGIDSIVVAEQVRRRHPELALFIASRAGDRFAAIEAPAKTTGLPVLRAERELDGQVLRSQELGFLNGHVPVTGILSSLAIATALLDGRDAVVMSNEWSASSGTLEVDGRVINHQWSKSYEFERTFREVLSESVAGLEYFSALRPYSELWVAQRMAGLLDYHLVFRSCNRAFALDPGSRLDRWCGQCDKCCFINLILAPFVDRQRLEQVFHGDEPLANRHLQDRFLSLLGDPALVKPFECVGDEGECRVAVLLAADRPDRGGTTMLQDLADGVRADGRPVGSPDGLLQPLGPHFIPDDYAARDLLG